MEAGPFHQSSPSKPKGLGIKSSLGPLSRFAQKWRQAELVGSCRQETKEAREVVEASGDGAPFEAAALAAWRQKIYRRVMVGKGKELALLRLLLNQEARVKRLELAAKQHALAERRFELMRKQIGIEKESESDEGLSETEKVRKAREKMFGPKALTIPGDGG
jgi:hypothetical protein